MEKKKSRKISGTGVAVPSLCTKLLFSKVILLLKVNSFKTDKIELAIAKFTTLIS